MKNNYNLFLSRFLNQPFVKKNRMLLAAVLLVLPQALLADAFQNSWFTASHSSCTNTVAITVGIYFDDSGTTNDDLWQNPSYIQINNGGLWENLAKIGGGSEAGAWNWNPNNDGGVFINPYSARNLHTPGITNNGGTSGDELVSASFTVNLNSSDVGQTIQFRVSGTWEDGGGSGIQTVVFTQTPDLASITAQDAISCTGTQISWSEPSDICPGSNATIYRNDIDIGSVPSANLNFTDATGIAGTTYQYKVRLNKLYPGQFYPAVPALTIDVFGVGVITISPAYPAVTIGAVDNIGGFSTENDGTKKAVPTFPSNLQATNENCDATVDISWDWSGVNPDNFEIFRNNVGLSPIGGNLRNYTDDVTRGVNYSYTIRAKNNCGWGALSPAVVGISPVDPDKVPDFNATVQANGEVSLIWVAATNTTTYQIERSLLGGGGSSFFDVIHPTVTYTDQSLVACQTYEYRIRSINDCSPTGVLSDSTTSAKVVPDLSNTFDNSSLNASKGYFPSRVELSWSLNNNSGNINQFKIYRKVEGSTNDSIIIQTLNSGSNIHNDYLAVAGELYKYTIVAEMQCEQNTVSSNAVSSIGFRSPIGTVSGQVNYTGGIAVENVKITAESSSASIGKSILFNGAQSLQIQNNANLNLSNGLSLEIWAKPTSHATGFSLIEKSTAYSLKHIGSSYEFEVFTSPTISQTVSIPDASVTLNTFNQFSGVLYNDTLRLFVNGVSSNYTILSGTVSNNTNPLNLGNSFSGKLDEFRLWNIGKSPATILRDFNRQLYGGETGLVCYLKMNEGVGSYAYDFSSSGISLYNKNHAQFINAPTWSIDIPTASQLSIAGYTNALGNYLLVVPYTGNGQTFVISPSYLVHNFTPSTRALFIGDGSAIHNNIDFEDISSFTVIGKLVYDSTNCSVEGAVLLVDGNQVIANGQPAITNNVGDFEIQVPIGQHSITIEKAGHTMTVGRFPATGTYDFQNDKAGINFKDGTLIKITGRVVGGLREAQYIPGLGKSKNNIGEAQIILTSQQGSGCFTDTVLTDAAGEYTTYAPPLKYIPTVTIPSNPAIVFGVLNLIDLNIVPNMLTAYDTLGYDSIAQVHFIDSFSFQKQLDYIYRTSPIIEVKGANEIDDFIGDEILEIINKNTGDTIVVDLVNNPMNWPVFTEKHPNDEDFMYVASILVYEPYINLDNGKMDSVPVTDGTLVFNNELAAGSAAQLELSKVNTLDTLKFVKYQFKPGKPNMNVNSSISSYSNTKVFELNLITTTGQAIPWLPIPSNLIPTGGTGLYRAYMLGSQSAGSQFITNGPDKTDFILRDPPGSSSFSVREVGKSVENSESWGFSAGAVSSATDGLDLGSKTVTGIGVATINETTSNFTVGLETSVSGGSSGSLSKTTTTTESWQTNDGTDQVGAGSDLFIGSSKNMGFGISTILTLIPDSLCPYYECLGVSQGDFSFAKTKTISMVPEGYETGFIYDANHIQNYLIPLIETARNAFLQGDSRYSTVLPTTNSNYGKNNDDPVFGAAATPNPKEFSYVDDRSGPSYVYTAQSAIDSLKDQVRTLNQQIRIWEETLGKNEFEKVLARQIAQGNNTLVDSLKIYEIALVRNGYTNTELTHMDSILAYSDANPQQNGINGIIDGIATSLVSLVPIPGSTIVGTVLFAATVSADLSRQKAYERTREYKSKLDKINSNFSAITSFTNHSINGGAVYTSSKTSEIVSTTEDSYEYSISPSFAANIQVNIGGTGFDVGRSITANYGRSNSYAENTTNNNTVSYTLNDPDQGDYFSVDVFQSIYGWGPIFRVRPGGQTSCPHEDLVLTEYYNPGDTLSDRTLQRDKATISAAPSILTNIPVIDAAVFNLTLNNISESNDARIYTVALHSPSNPFGAIVKIDGFQPFADVNIPGGTSINKVLTIEKGPGSVYNYDSLLMLIYAPCQYDAGTSDNRDLVDSVYISAHFLPTCTDINFAIPDDHWVLNNSFADTMPIGILDYNINFFDFESIRLDYKASSQATWVGLQTFHKDTVGMNDSTAILIPTSTAFTLWDWETDQIVDGDYDLRLVTHCTLADVTSVTHSGVMDRINPHPFGTPSPADGILDPNDDIKIKFNENIDLGSMTSLNFDIRGVLNGTETNHFSNLYFDGTNDFVEVTAGIPVQSRDFTLEFSVKRTGTGQEAILSQGSVLNEQIYVGFNGSNQLEFKINDQTLTSTTSYTDNDWHYFAVAYSYDNETAEMFEASGSSTTALINNGNTAIYSKYQGSDKLFIGKSVVNGSFFNGNIDDVRIWNTTRTLSEFSVNKSILLSSNALGLLYNWRFDEADGNFAKDHARARDGIINGAEWTIEPSGNAVSFDGTDDYLRINKGDVNITDEMDFTLEFWFNSTQAGAATLVSNGTGTGLAVDSLYSWNIAKDAAGQIHVYHNGNDFVAVNDNYFDGEWHHFALVLNRLGSISAYLDGNLQNTTQSLAFAELGGSGLYLGARGYYTGTVENFDNYFNGQLDEFRFWNASRKAEQIQRDKQNRMKGDEFALKLYLPFENYQLDPTGIALLTPTFSEQIDSLNHTVLNPNGATLTTTVPKIKVQRPIESIAFTYSLNGDEIIITPTTSQEIIENVTLDITVEGLKDKNGNYMQSPKTWIAYVDKNQVVWQDDVLSFEKDFGATISFTSAVVNNGGAQKAFTISNVPSWLTVIPMSGIIAPNSTISVSCTIDPNVNIGDYLQDLHLLTDFGFPEKLTIDLKVREEEPSWAVNPADFTNSMSVIGYVEINDVVSTSAEDMLAVFVDDTCRGSAHLQYVPLMDRYLVFLDVYSNLNNGELLEFKVWDASSGTIFSEITPDTIGFVANGLIGSILAPQKFETSYEIELAIPLNTGWNWVSHFLLNPDSLDLDKTLESLESVTGDEIKGISNFSNYLASNGWVGSLNNNGIRPEDGYKLKVSHLDTLVLQGDIIDPTSRVINLALGWNWVGYVSVRNQSVIQALGNLNPTDGDIIKAQSQFAVYDNLLGWVGSLQTMKPGTGYMYYTTNAASFVYPAIGQFKFGIADANEIYKNKKWVVNNEQYASNMTIISSLDTDCEYIENNSSIAIGVFDEEANCRAVNLIENLEENQYSFLTVGGKNSTKLRFGILDTKTGRSYDLAETINFSSNQREGTVSEPFMLKVSDEICFKMQFEKVIGGEETDEEIVSGEEMVEVYPTLFAEEINIYFFTQNPVVERQKVKLYNLWGQLVYEESFSEQKGYNKVSFDVSKKGLSVGVYQLVVGSESSEMHSFKVVKK